MRNPFNVSKGIALAYAVLWFAVALVVNAVVGFGCAGMFFVASLGYAAIAFYKFQRDAQLARLNQTPLLPDTDDYEHRQPDVMSQGSRGLPTSFE